MEIQYAILGLLSWRAMSGYEIKKRISESELFYWSGTNNQIYYSLVELHNDGLVSQEVQAQESLPAKKIYSITEKGRERLRQWAGAAPELPERRHNFLIQLAWAEPLSTAEVLDLLDRYEEEMDIQARMRRARGPEAAPDRSERERFLWEKIHEHLLADIEQELDWVRRVRAGLVGKYQDRHGKEIPE